MLRSLHIENYALIDSLDIEFPDGLVIITGQTGAGKSILLGALSLLTGTKADTSVIAEGAQSCIVEAEFETDDPEVKAAVEEAEAEWADGQLTIRRMVSQSGRSRSYVNDCPVPVQMLQNIASHIVDIHSQHQSLMLQNRKYQMRLLDLFARDAKEAGQVASAWKRLQNLRTEYAEVTSRLDTLRSERDYNQARFDQLDKAGLKDGELEELEEEQKRLANAEAIRDSLGSASNMFEGSDGPSMAEALKEARKALEKAGRFVPAAAELALRIESSRLEIEDIASETESLAEGICLSEERLQEVDERIGLLYELFRQHGCRTIAELIEVRERFSSALFDSTSLEERKTELEAEIEAQRQAFAKACEELTAKRSEAAPAFARSIEESMRFLELDRAVFEVRLTDTPPGPDGAEDVTFAFSSTGVNPIDVGKCASGGEISRIMLCLKAMMARFTGMPTLIFDEIDTGVSGSAADKMGSMICSMGDDMQVFSITHLPQVAAKGKAHYAVSKAADVSGRVCSRIDRLSDSQRIEEIARLLSGSSITPEALANARRLLDK